MLERNGSRYNVLVGKKSANVYQKEISLNYPWFNEVSFSNTLYFEIL